MAIAIIPKEELISFVPAQHHSQMIAIYNEIPTNLIKFLEQKNVVRQLNFKRTMHADNKSIGNEYNKQWAEFVNHVCRSIRQVFQEENITCIDPHELAVDISNRYLKLQPTWARRAQKLWATLNFNKIYTIHDNDIQVARTDVDVKVKVDESCEDNCFDTNQYCVSYDVEIKLEGLTVDGHKVRALCEVINREGVVKSIEHIRSKT